MREVAGEGAILCEPDDHAAFGRAILEVARDARRREALVKAGFRNSLRFERAKMIDQFTSLYERVVGRSWAPQA
jgi:glycosyltransferase involved in cell wall biosynthesis